MKREREIYREIPKDKREELGIIAEEIGLRSTSRNIVTLYLQERETSEEPSEEPTKLAENIMKHPKGHKFKYTASESDFTAIEEAIRLVSKSNLFKYNIDKANILMYDSTNLYLWSKKKYPLEMVDKIRLGYYLYQFSHGQDLSKNYKDYFSRCGGTPKELRQIIINTIGENGYFNCFTCAPMTTLLKLQREWLKLQKVKGRKVANPYTTKEGYYLTLIHEIAHHYDYQYGTKLKLKKDIEKIVEKLKVDKKNRIRVVKEAFAIYFELMAARIFFPKLLTKYKLLLTNEYLGNSHHIGIAIAMSLVNIER